jgi:hypothetical protein
LVSCHPRYSTRERIVVSAELDTTASAAVGRPLVYYQPFDDPDVSDLPATDTELLPTDDEDPEPTSTDPPQVVPTPASAFEDDDAQAFSEGWFHDRDAWPQVVLWFLAFGATWIAIVVLAHRFRSYPAGIALGCVPFVVTLYFVFQNANRLLPAGI